MESKNKKILYVITQSDFGGAQRYVFDLTTHLSADFDIVVAAGENPDGELFKRLEIPPLPPPLNKGRIRGEVKTIHLKHLRRAINPYHDLMAFFEIKRLIKKEKPDIIHLNSSKAGILGSLAAQSAIGSGTPLHIWRIKPLAVIYTAHGWVFNEPLNWLKKKIYLWLEKFTARHKNKTICVSEYDRQSAIRHGFTAEKLTTIHNGIDFNNLYFLDKETARQKLSTNLLSLTSNHFLVGSIANLYPTKGIRYLIEAFHLLNTKPPAMWQNAKCIVIGEGPERAKLENLIKKYNLVDKFFLLGHIENASQYLKAFDIFVLPSVKEGLPYAILEAVSASLPIIATRVGGVPEMLSLPPSSIKEESFHVSPPPFNKGGIRGGVGLLINPRNPDELAEKIAHLLQNEEICRNLSENARIAVQENFSLEKMITKTKKVYF